MLQNKFKMLSSLTCESRSLAEVGKRTDKVITEKRRIFCEKRLFMKNYKDFKLSYASLIHVP